MTKPSSEDGDQTPKYSWIDELLPDRPRDVEAGDTWRSKEIYRCQVCHTLINNWIIGGYPSRGPRIRCPANRSIGETMYEQPETDEREKKHKQLRELVIHHNELEERLQQYGSDTDAERRTRERVHDEPAAIDNQIASLREWFDNKFDDIASVDPAEQEVITGPTSRYEYKRECPL